MPPATLHTTIARFHSRLGSAVCVLVFAVVGLLLPACGSSGGDTSSEAVARSSAPSDVETLVKTASAKLFAPGASARVFVTGRQSFFDADAERTIYFGAGGGQTGPAAFRLGLECHTIEFVQGANAPYEPQQKFRLETIDGIGIYVRRPGKSTWILTAAERLPVSLDLLRSYPLVDSSDTTMSLTGTAETRGVLCDVVEVHVDLSALEDADPMSTSVTSIAAAFGVDRESALALLRSGEFSLVLSIGQSDQLLHSELKDLTVRGGGDTFQQVSTIEYSGHGKPLSPPIATPSPIATSPPNTP